MPQPKRRRPGASAGPEKVQDAATTSTSLTETVLTVAEKNPAGHNASRISERLRRAREGRDETVQEIATKLRIKPGFLAALENGQYDELPANAYTVGFLRTYANYLGLDGEAILEDYRSEMQGRNRAPQLLPPQPIAEGKTPSTPILIGSAVLALLIYGAWLFFSSADRSVVTAPPALPETASETTTPATDTAQTTELGVVQPVTQTQPEGAMAPLVMTPTSQQPAGTPLTQGIILNAPAPQPSMESAVKEPAPKEPVTDATTGSEPAPHVPEVFGDKFAPARMIIRAEKDSWVVIQSDGGEKLFSHMLKAGDSYRVPNRPGLTITTGNAGGVVLNVNGQDLPKLGKVNQIIRAMSLDSAAKGGQ